MIIMHRVNAAMVVALRKESVDRNYYADKDCDWVRVVALRKESVDRNPELYNALSHVRWSLSARRAWIEITCSLIPALLL